MYSFRDLGNKKLQQLVETAWSLFWKYGFTRVSIEEICREARVSKMTFYKHFGNKTELVQFLLKEQSRHSLELYDKIMSGNAPFTEKVRQSIQFKLEQTENLSEAFFNDFHKQNDPELNRILLEQKSENIKAVIRWYLEAQKKGDIRKDIKPEFIVYFLNHLMDMARDEKLLAMYESPQELVMELTNFFFYGLLPADKR